MKLAPEVRQRIYKFHFAMKGITTKAIALDAKRKATGLWYAKGFAGSDKNRVAVLAVNKEVCRIANIDVEFG
jgi:hypothetical protein